MSTFHTSGGIISSLKSVQKRNIFMTVSPCVSFMFIQDGNVLLEQRSKNKLSDPNVICIPGGHIENGENQVEALHREVKEELGVNIVSSQFLCSLYHPTSELQLLHYYLVTDWEGEIQNLEAEALLWKPVEEMAAHIDADKTALREYLRLASFLPH